MCYTGSQYSRKETSKRTKMHGYRGITHYEKENGQCTVGGNVDSVCISAGGNGDALHGVGNGDGRGRGAGLRRRAAPVCDAGEFGISRG